MADCELLEGCLFFNDKMYLEEELAAIYKNMYCRGDNSNCARFMVFKKLGKPAVPDNLYPNMVDRAKGILAAV